jgi:hypothetical protein
MKMLDFWRRKTRRLPATPVPLAPPLRPLSPATGQKGDKGERSENALSRARAADTDGRARRRRQLVEDNRLL